MSMPNLVPRLSLIRGLPHPQASIRRYQQRFYTPTSTRTNPSIQYAVTKMRVLPSITTTMWTGIDQSMSYTSFQYRSNKSVQGRRCFSSRTSGKDQQQGFQLDALPFTVSPEDALEKFKSWARNDQGLQWLLRDGSIRIGAAYVPVWSFDLNVRFANSASKPPMFDIYQGNTIHLPGLAAYAGYSYRRSLINPVHSTSLVFLGKETQPFGGWMLRDMPFKDGSSILGTKIPVIPDAWNATRGRTLHYIREDLQGLAQEAWYANQMPDMAPPIQIEVESSRRVFLPTFVLEYSIAGLQYQAFVSGCDEAAPVSGVSHQVFGEFNVFQSPEFFEHSRNFLSWSSAILRQPRALPFLLQILRPVATLGWFALLRLWAALPIVGAATGVVAGYRKLLEPWWKARTASAEWERQRDHEALRSEQDDAFRNEFSDQGRSRRYFARNRTEILHHLSGAHEHQEGTYDWYAEWEKWAEAQWRQQQAEWRQQQAQGGNYYEYGQRERRQEQQQARQQQQRSQQKKETYHWDFDVNDPYSVLGVSRGATKKQVSEAFRKKMLQYHPDTQPNATEAQKRRLVEHSKLITEAYRKIRSQQKKN